MSKLDKYLLPIIFFTIAIIAFYGLNKERNIDSNYFSMLESDFVEYKAFNEELDKMFPYYEPDGFNYKGKLAAYFEQKETEAANLYKLIIAGIPDTIEWERADGSIFRGPPTDFTVKEDLQKLHPIFPEYRRLICGLREEEWQGGSGRSAWILSCEIYETQKYIKLLKKYYEDLIEDNSDIGCINIEDYGEFDEPIPVVWEAELTGCLSSCHGAHFSRLPLNKDFKYPRFSGYFIGETIEMTPHGDKKIPEKFLKNGLALRLYGKWIDVGASYVNTVFGGMCTPTVDIEKIEII